MSSDSYQHIRTRTKYTIYPAGGDAVESVGKAESMIMNQPTNVFGTATGTFGTLQSSHFLLCTGTTGPSVLGSMYMDKNTGLIKVYNGTTWATVAYAI